MKQKILKVLTIVGVSVASISMTWAAYSTVVFLRTSPRLDVQKLKITDLKRVREEDVLAVSGHVVGMNILRADLDEVRDRVEELPWVRHAIVSRILPDEVAIRVVERVPVALARIRGEIFQVDEDAAILAPDTASMSSFPVLDGLRPNDADNNVLKVATYQSVVEGLGQSELSEVHISDKHEVSVIPVSDPIKVSLGTDDFRTRWLRYLQLKSQIREQYPQAAVVDLRFRNQIIIRLKDDAPESDVVWHEKKRSL